MLNINVPADYKPTQGEINNLVYITCKYTCGWAMRQCDLVVIQAMWMAHEKTGAEGITLLLETACEYIWDHICGEPEEVSPEKFLEHLTPNIEEWYRTTTPEERANIE